MDTPRGKILVVDDDEDLKMVIADILKKNNWFVVTASDGAEAVSKAQNQKFDFIVCDIFMPKIRGDDSIRFIKDNSENSETPVIIVSGALDAKVLANLRGLVARAFIKPFDIEELVTYVAQQLEAKIAAKMEKLGGMKVAELKKAKAVA